MGDMGVAWVLLAQYCALLHLPAPANMADYIRTWQGRLNPDGAVARRARNTCRPSSISPQMVEAACQGIIGWRKSGMTRPYRTRAHCTESSPAVMQVLQETGARGGGECPGAHAGRGQQPPSSPLQQKWLLGADSRNTASAQLPQPKPRSARQFGGGVTSTNMLSCGPGPHAQAVMLCHNNNSSSTRAAAPEQHC